LSYLILCAKDNKNIIMNLEDFGTMMI